MRDAFGQLYRLELIVSCLLLVARGIALLVVERQMPADTPSAG